MDKYYKATVKAGHVGKNNYIEVTLFICAETKKSAAEQARWTPRVKHHDKGAIIDVVEITHDEYKKGKVENSMNPYFKVMNIQEQRALCGQMDVKQNKSKDNEKNHSKYSCIKEFRNSNPRKFQKYYGAPINHLWHKDSEVA